MILAERFPVPVDGWTAAASRSPFVFAVAAIVLFGWEAGAFLLAATAVVTSSSSTARRCASPSTSRCSRSSRLRRALDRADPGDSVGALLARVVVAAIVDNIVNIVLISAVIALSSNKPFLKLMDATCAQTIVPFAFMASAALMLVVLWERSPVLSVALVGPLLAIALYQRSTHSALRAMRLALTDPLTGLGNHRHFHERLQRELLNAEDRHDR